MALQKLDLKQYAAVSSKASAVLCDSKAGSGKTRVLMNRCLYLMDNGVKPENILLVTFTNKAAEEMKDRITKLSPVGMNILCGTFHNIGIYFLKKYGSHIGIENNFSIITPSDTEKILKKMSKQYKKTVDEEFIKEASPKKITNLISKSNSLNCGLKEYAESQNYRLGAVEYIVNIVNDLNEYKEINNLLDFDDILINFWKLLLVKEVADEIHSQYFHILVDEFQDVNEVQSEIVANLKGPNNLFVVGDPFQSIYGFRGSDIRFINDFPTIYDAAVYNVDYNYRSTQEILDLANKATKNLALMTGMSHGERPEFRRCYDNMHQANLIGEKVKSWLNSGVPGDEIAVLVRSTVDVYRIEAALAERNIPYVLRAGFAYFEKEHIKDLLSILSVRVNDKNALFMKRALELCPSIGSKAADKLINAYQSLGCWRTVKDAIESKKLKVSEKIQTSFEIFYDLMTFGSNRDAYGVLTHICKNFYDEYIDKNFKDDSEERKQDIKRLFEMAKKANSIEALLDKISVDTSINNKDSADPSVKKVVVSTIHRAKGLEWDNCIIANMDIPYIANNGSSSEDNRDDYKVPEQDRLLYVAITRARKKLCLFVNNARGPVSKTKYNLAYETNALFTR